MKMYSVLIVIGLLSSLLLSSNAAVLVNYEFSFNDYKPYDFPRSIHKRSPEMIMPTIDHFGPIGEMPGVQQMHQLGKMGSMGRVGEMPGMGNMQGMEGVGAMSGVSAFTMNSFMSMMNPQKLQKKFTSA